MAFSIAGNNNSPCVMSVRSANGIWLEDASGRRCADFYGNNAHHIGYRHPVLIEALHKQLDQLTFTPRGLTSETSRSSSARYCLRSALWGDPKAKVSLAPSGGDANDAAICFRCESQHQGRYKTVSFYDAFHGRNSGALSVGGGYSDRRTLGPVMPGTLKVPPPSGHSVAVNSRRRLRRSLNSLTQPPWRRAPWL